MTAAGPYADAAFTYRGAGWDNVLPLPPHKKKPVPTGYTGYAGATPSYADVYAWTEDRPDGNIAIRLQRGIIGIDVDDYEDKQGKATLEHAIAQWGPLPATWISTNREDGISGIRLYRVPDDADFVSNIGEPTTGGIEIIRYGHRYIVAAPSVHPSGRIYRWQAPDGFWSDEIPTPDEIPALPAQWLMALRREAVQPTATADVTAVLRELDAGQTDATVTAYLAQAMTELDTPGGNSRHDLCSARVMGLFRLAEQKHPGIRGALGQLRAHFVRCVTDDGTRSPDEAYAEFDRMVLNRRGHDLIASTPTPDHAADNQALAALAGTQDASRDLEQATQLPILDDTVLEWFWGGGEHPHGRRYLATIQQFAHARRCSPWAVLGVVLCRVITTIPPHVTLPAVIGGRGSLNLFVCLVGVPGLGKGGACTVAEDLYPGPDGVDAIHVAGSGSAEGIAHQYMHRDGKTKEIVWDRNAVLFNADEIDTFAGLGERSGSVLWPTLRSAFMGANIGFSYADPTKRLPLDKHTYRLTMTIGVQPEHAAPILADASGGFPQRCLWFPTIDPTMPDERPPEPEPLDYFDPREWSGSMTEQTIKLPDSVVEEIDRNHLARVRGQTEGLDDLDGHATFVREKVAVALAVLHGRRNVNENDWALAEIVMAVSNDTRTAVEKACVDAVAMENTGKAVQAGRRQVISDDVVNKDAFKKACTGIRRRLLSHGPMTEGKLKNLLTRGAVREAFEEALADLEASGVVEQIDGKWGLA